MMSLLDGSLGYNQIRVKREDKYKTTFTTRWGSSMYERLPFGLINAGENFHRATQITFDDMNGQVIEVYLDELILFEVLT